MKTVKFFKVNNFETIRNIRKVDEKGNKSNIIAVLGQCKEMYENELIFVDNVKGNENKWLVIINYNDVEIEPLILDFDDIDSAKDFCRKHL